MATLNIPNVRIPKVNGAITFEFDLPDSIIAGQPFPEAAFENGAIKLAEVNASANKNIDFGTGDRKVSFGADGGGHASVGVYRTTKNLFKDLAAAGLSDEVADLLGFTIDPADNLIAIRWGYDLAANVNSMVFGSPVKVSVGGSAKKDGLFAVLHAVKRSRGARLSVTDGLKAWRLPTFIKTIDDIEPRTTLISETGGSLGLNLGVEYGYSYSWTKEAAKLGALEGDIGLKINAGIKAQLGYHAEGLFSVAISRESTARNVRVRVYRLKQKAVNVGFNAGFDFKFEAADSLFPDRFEEFLKGVFNLQGSQVLNDFFAWADSNEGIDQLLGPQLHKYSKDLLSSVTGLDIDTRLDEATELLKDTIKKWHELPEDIAGVVREAVGSVDELNKLRNFLEKAVSVSSNSKTLVDFVESEVASVDFFTSPVGKWLLLSGKESATSILANLEDKKAELADTAKKTLAVLDGNKVESTITELQGFIDEKLSVEKLENLDVDEWMKQRLTDFIGKAIGDDEIAKLSASLRKLKNNADKFYEIGKTAMLKKYKFSIAASFSNESSKRALVDVMIDYDAAGASKQSADRSLQAALSGDFGELLVEPRAEVRLNSALLTHGIKRQSHVEINLPFFESDITHINEAIATARPQETPDGRVWLFEVNATDIKKRKKRFMSKLSIASQVSLVNGGLRTFDPAANRAHYDLRIAERKATTRFVERRLEFAATTYLGEKFPTEDAFREYLLEINNTVDTANIGSLGNFMASLEVSMPGRVLEAWNKLPPRSDTVFFQRVSGEVQRLLRKWVPEGYIYDPETQFKSNAINQVFPLLAYSALPTYLLKRSEGLFYWNYGSAKKRLEVFNGPQFIPRLRNVLERTRAIVPPKDRERYDPSNAANIAGKVLGVSAMKNNFENLCDLELTILKGIRGTSDHYQKFSAAVKAKKLEKANKFLSDFGSELVETFNDDLGGNYAGKSMRPLGLMLMYELAKLWDSGVPVVVPTAMFRTMVLKPDATFIKEKFLDGTDPQPGDILLQPVAVVESGESG